MEITQNTIMNWEDVKKYYPNEWVVLGNPIFEGMNVLEGIVLAHHTDKRVASIEGGERRADFNKFTLIFMSVLFNTPEQPPMLYSQHLSIACTISSAYLYAHWNLIAPQNP